MPNIAAGASVAVTLSPGARLNIIGFGTVSLGSAPRGQSLVVLDGDSVIGPFLSAQTLYVSAASDVDYTEVIPGQIATGGADVTTLPVRNTLSTAAKFVMEDGGGARVGVDDVFTQLGTTIGSLATAPAIADTYVLELFDPATGASFKATVAALKTAFGGGATAPGDVIKPTVTAASITNATPNQINITFSEALSGTLPAASSFTPSGGRTATAISGSGSALTVTMSTAASYGETVTLDYTQPGTNPLQDAAQNKADSFAGRAVVNNVAAPAGTPATAVTMTGPTGGNVSVASTNFSVGVSPVGGTITGTLVVTPSDNGGGGTFNPATVSLTTAVPTATFTYTPSATAGARTISATNSGTLANPANLTYTVAAAAQSYTFTRSSPAGTPLVPTTGKALTAAGVGAGAYNNWTALAATLFTDGAMSFGVSPVPPDGVWLGGGTSNTTPPPLAPAGTSSTAATMKVAGGKLLKATVGAAFTNGQYYSHSGFLFQEGIPGTYLWYYWLVTSDGVQVCLNPNNPITITIT